MKFYIEKKMLYQKPRAKSQEQRRKDRRAEQPKSDRGHDGQHEQRRENGLPPEIRGDRNVHAFDGGQVEIVRSEIKALIMQDILQRHAK